MLSDQEIQFLIKRHENKISLGGLLDLYKAKYPNVSYMRVAKELYKDLKIKYEPQYKTIDGVFMLNPEYGKDYGFNSYFIPNDENFLTVEFDKDKGGYTASALHFLIYETSDVIVDDIEQSLNCTADDYLGAYSDIFLDVVQLSEKFNISVLSDYKKQVNKSENLIKPEIKEEDDIENLRSENETLRARITELESQLQKQSAVDPEQVLELPKATRTSQAQRDIFSLLVVKNFSDYPTRNSLFESINEDLKSTGINTSGISYQTFDNLVDENLRIKAMLQNGKTIEKSPFPDKAKK